MPEPVEKPTCAQSSLSSFWLAALAITVLGLALRLGLLCHTYDSARDAYHRAYVCYTWALHPHLINGEVWAPALTYIGGILNLLGVDPFLALRAVSLVCGVVLLPVLAVLYENLFGRARALLAVFLLSLFPLLVGLSVSSLCEVPQMLFFFTGYLLLLKATDAFFANANCRWWLLLFCILSFSFSSATRVESWLFIPLWLVYFLAQTRKPAATVVLACGLAAFPVYWIAACTATFHSPFLSFLSQGPIYQELHTGLLVASGQWFVCSFYLLGALLLLAILLGYAGKARRTLEDLYSKRFEFDRSTLHFFVASLSWLLAINLVNCFGLIFEYRFLALVLVLLMPYAGAVFDLSGRWLKEGETPAGLYRLRAIIVALLLASTMMLTFQFCRPDIHVSSDLYKPVEDVARFLNSKAVNRCPLLTTNLRWSFQGYRLALLCREKFKQITLIDSYYACLPVMQARVSKYPPELFVATNLDYVKDIPYASKAIRFQLEPACLFRSDAVGESLTIHRIVPGSVGVETPIKNASSCWRTDIKVSQKSAKWNYCDYEW